MLTHNKKAHPEPLLVTARNAAAMLAMSERKLWSLSNEGRIRRRKIDGMVRYAVEDLRAFLRAELESSNA